MRNMRQICRVLLWVGEQEEPVTIEQVADGVGITYEQARASLRQLRIKQKLKAANDLTGRVRYQDNEDYTPPDRPVAVRCRSPVAKAAEAGLPVAVSSMFKFADKKISLLRRLQDRCVDSDADLIEGIIKDYEAVTVKKAV